MENAADALKIAFVIFVFIAAIGITFTLISQAKSTADSVFYHSDETNFYEYSKGNSEKNRIVSITEIIPNLYRYYKESIGVIIQLKNGDNYTFDLNNKEDDIFIQKSKLTSLKDREENISKFINNYLLELPEDTKFTEEFVEIPISGIYEYGEDGTELEISSGGKKVYITYTEYTEVVEE